MTKTPESYFPADYRFGRAAFIEACEDADLGVTARVHPSAKGPDGKPLFIDVATIGAREAKTALLLISGTHGVEGYFGSGVETGLLREGLARRAPKGAKIVLLHALNPYGFAWNRRVNEDNADINRNFVDHARPPANAAYEELSEFIAPQSISPVAMKKANARLREYAREHGDFALQEAISAGQYSHADGLYFGGAQMAWSAAMLKDVFVEELAHVTRLIVIDFHTGLGKSGAAEMITEDLPGSAGYARATAMWGGLVHSSEAGESLSAPLTGTLDVAVAQWMKGKELTFAALEVGTAPLRDVFLSLRKDNWLHTRATPAHRSAKAIKRAIRAAFFPDTTEWKRSVWTHARAAVDAACTALT